jgi:hypothetical protein
MIEVRLRCPNQPRPRDRARQLKRRQSKQEEEQRKEENESPQKYDWRTRDGPRLRWKRTRSQVQMKVTFILDGRIENTHLAPGFRVIIIEHMDCWKAISTCFSKELISG